MLLHACADVTGHAEDYRNGNAGFCHSRNGCVTKIVDSQPGHAGRFANRLPRLADAAVRHGPIEVPRNRRDAKRHEVMMRTHRSQSSCAFHEPGDSPDRFVVHGNCADAIAILRVLAANVQDFAVEVYVAKAQASHLAIRSRGRKREQRIAVNKLPLLPA